MRLTAFSDIALRVLLLMAGLPDGTRLSTQRIAEGVMLELHANTWRYNQLTAQQRAILVERRDKLLRTTTARDELRELVDAHWDEHVQPVLDETSAHAGS